MHFGLHHHHRRMKRKKTTTSNKNLEKLLDWSIYFVAVFSPLMTIPQAYLIYNEKNAAGVSAISWFAYLVASIIWLVYGLVHHEKPIIISNTAWTFLAFLVFVGALLYS